MINRECGVYQTTYEGDMALYPLPLARYSTLGVVAVLVLLPLVLDSHAMSLVNLMLLASIGAIGLNVLVGYTGQVSLGHGAFMMVGSYTAALVTLRLGAPFWVGLPAGGAMAALVGTFFGIPSLRIKGLYLAIATLAGQFIIEWSINHSTWISGGVQSTIYVPTPTFFGWQINSEYRRYMMVLPVAIVAYVAALNLVRSRVGRAFIAVRDRDVAAEIIGVDIFRYKLLAFAVSSFYGDGRRPLDLLSQDCELRALHPRHLGLVPGDDHHRRARKRLGLGLRRRLHHPAADRARLRGGGRRGTLRVQVCGDRRFSGQPQADHLRWADHPVPGHGAGGALPDVGQREALFPSVAVFILRGVVTPLRAPPGGFAP